MYYFIYKGDAISQASKTIFFSHLKAAAEKHRQTYTYNEANDSFTLSTLFLSIKENQILTYSKYDFEEGCTMIDVIITFILENFGSVYTTLEP